MDIDEEGIVVHNWPGLKETTDGRWKREWNIRLLERIEDPSPLRQVEELLSTEENEVKLSVDDKILVATVVTRRWGWEDDLYFFTYDLLEAIDRDVSEIDLIEGQARNLWDPWLTRLRGSASGDK